MKFEQSSGTMQDRNTSLYAVPNRQDLFFPENGNRHSVSVQLWITYLIL